MRGFGTRDRRRAAAALVLAVTAVLLGLVSSGPAGAVTGDVVPTTTTSTTTVTPTAHIDIIGYSSGVAVGGSFRVSAQVSGIDAQGNILFHPASSLSVTSSDPSVASVGPSSNGPSGVLITGVAPGTSTITASASDWSAPSVTETWTLTVVPASTMTTTTTTASTTTTAPSTNWVVGFYRWLVCALFHVGC